MKNIYVKEATTFAIWKTIAGLPVFVGAICPLADLSSISSPGDGGKPRLPS
jgi:hypothetical protein